MEKKSTVTAEQLAAFKDGKLSEEEREKVLEEVSKDPELYEELCALEEIRLADQAGLPVVPAELERKAHGSFHGSAGSKMLIFLSGKAVPIAAAVICVAALVYLAVHFAGKMRTSAKTPAGTATATGKKPASGTAGRTRTSRRSGQAARSSKSGGESREAAQPRKSDPYRRFQYKVPAKAWTATRKLLDTDAGNLLAEFRKEKHAEEVVYALSIKGKEVLPQLIELAGSGSETRRTKTLEILGLMAVFGHFDQNEKKAVGRAVSERLSNDLNAEVKAAALDTVEKLKLDGKETFSILADALSDHDAGFRARIVAMLPRYSADDAALKIAELLDSDPSPEVKSACIDAAKKLGRISDDMLDAIGRLMDGASDPRVRFSAITFMKSNSPNFDDEEMKKQFDERVFRALVAVIETNAGNEPVKPGTRASKYTKENVMPDVESRIMALELLVRSVGKDEKDSAETTIIRLAGNTARPALAAAALLSLDRFNKERAFEMLLEAVKSVQIDDQENLPAFNLYCSKLDSIARQSFGLKAGLQEGDYYAALEKAENWFAENRHALAPKEEEER